VQRPQPSLRCGRAGADILTRIFSYALELELIEKTPIKRGIAPKLERTEKPPLTEEQLFALLDVVPICYRAFYMTLALTGIRNGRSVRFEVGRSRLCRFISQRAACDLSRERNHAENC
jgi:integrase